MKYYFAGRLFVVAVFSLFCWCLKKVILVDPFTFEVLGSHRELFDEPRICCFELINPVINMEDYLLFVESFAFWSKEFHWAIDGKGKLLMVGLMETFNRTDRLRSVPTLDCRHGELLFKQKVFEFLQR